MDNIITTDSTITMKDLLASSDFALPKTGQVLQGVIMSSGKSAVLIDLGTLGTGIVYPGEFYDNPNLQKSLTTGQTVHAILLDVEDGEGQGYRELSLKEAQQTTAWEDIKEKKEKNEVIGTRIVNINKGGLIVEVNGVQGFLPLSQLSSDHYPKVEGGDTTKIVQILQKYRNQEFQVKILDFNEAENKLIVSEKAINDAQVKAQLSKFALGDIIHGTITDVTDFGAFMLLSSQGEVQNDGKLEGLIHISEIDWKMIENPRDILSPGQEVDAKVISIENGKVSLSLKVLKEDPWIKARQTYKPEQLLKGKIAKTTPYGALVSLDNSITGLIPISEFGGKKPSEIVAVGEEHEITIVSVDAQEHKMLLKLTNLHKTNSKKSIQKERIDSNTE